MAKKTDITNSQEVNANTVLVTYATGERALFFHGTEITRWRADGSATITTGGWYTSTTRKRLNAHGPDGVRIGGPRKGPWNISGKDGKSYPFYDGIAVTKDGKIVHNPPAKTSAKVAKAREAAREAHEAWMDGFKANVLKKPAVKDAA